MEAGLRAQLRYKEDLGSHSIIAADLAGQTLRVATPFGADAPDFNVLSFSFPSNRLHLFDTKTGKAIPGAVKEKT